MMPVQYPEKPNGLGFDMEDDRRQSASDDSTLEISTPTHGHKGGYMGYGDETVVIPATLHEPPLSPAAAFQKRSPETNPPSRRGSDGSDDSDGQSLPRCMHTPPADMVPEYIIRHAPIYPVVKIGTPGESDISATKRRSIVPSVGDSLGSLSTLCQDQVDLPATTGQQLATHQRRNSRSSSGSGYHRDSTAVSFIDEFPSPPNFAEPSFSNLASTMPSASTSKHSTAFGQLVTGPPGAGKTTYCHGMHQVS
jgi:hypothetical protein